MFGVSGLRYQLLNPPTRDSWRTLRARVNYSVWSLYWIVGHIAGGALVGAVLGWMGTWLPLSGRLIGLAFLSLACVAWGLHQFRLIRLPMPQLHRQVPRTWLLRVPWSLLGLGYGLQLGCGIATRIKVATTYAVLGCALLTGSPAAGALILGLFGAARSVLPVVLGPRLASPHHSLAFTLGFDAHEKWIGKLNGAVLLVTAVLLAGWAWRCLET